MAFWSRLLEEMEQQGQQQRVDNKFCPKQSHSELSRRQVPSKDFKNLLRCHVSLTRVWLITPKLPKESHTDFMVPKGF